MKIAINAWVLRKRTLDGIGTFTKETCSRMIAAHPEVEFLVLCDKGFTAPFFDFPNASIYRIFPPYRHPLLYVIFMETVLPLFLRRHRPELLLSTDGILSLSTATPQLACIHDINYMHQPGGLDLKNRLYYPRFFPRFARKATRIATVSTYSKEDIVRTFGIAEEKIDVIFSGIKSGLHALSPDLQVSVRQRWTGGKPYFLFVGTLHPRKNIVRLLEAFDLFKEAQSSEVSLVIVGNFMWDASDIKDVYASLKAKEDVVVTGWVNEQELGALYGAALAITFVPTFEGFGLPIVEGFAAGVPVITSNITSMPEVGGDAALFVNPLEVKEIAAAMQRLASDDGTLRAEMIRKGNLQRQKFSWDSTAALLWESCKKALPEATATL